jgi:hypothetical protein
LDQSRQLFCCMSEGRDFNPAALGSEPSFAAVCMNDRFGRLQPFVFLADCPSCGRSRQMQMQQVSLLCRRYSPSQYSEL